MDSLVYPFFNKKFNKTISVNSRLVFGMSLSAMSVIVAGLLETVRIESIQDDPVHNTIKQVIGNTTYIASTMHILWQIPQYVLIGLGEVFCSVCCVYYAYSASPKSMQSILMGFFYFFTGTGSLMGSFTLYLFKRFIYSSQTNVDDINCPNCRLNFYFYLIAALQIVGLLLYILIDSKYTIVKCKLDNDGNTANTTTSNNKLYLSAVDLNASNLENESAASKINYINNIDSRTEIRA